MVYKYKISKNKLINILKKNNGNRAAAARELGVPREVICHRCNLWDIPKIHTRTYKNSFNEHYFDIIDSNEKAFFLGVLFGSGCLIRRQNRTKELSIDKSNKDLLLRLISALEATNKLNKYQSINKTIYSLTFTSNHFCEIIYTYGKPYGDQSHNNLTFPNIPESFILDFINGFVQSNSSCFYNNNLITLDIHGPSNFLEKIKFKLSTGGSIGFPTKWRSGCRLRYSGRKQIEHLKSLNIEFEPAR